MIPRHLHILSNYHWFLDNSRRRYRLMTDHDDQLMPEGEPTVVQIIRREGSPTVVAPFDAQEVQESDEHAEALLVRQPEGTVRLFGKAGR